MTTQAPPAKLSDEYEGRTGAVLARVQALYPKLIDLSLDRLHTLLGKLGNPERALPPVIHVAGTNGKGSTCATLRAIAEAAGWSVHVMTSPHLVDVTERFRIAGQLVSEDALVATLEEIERVNGDAPITVFEVLTAAGFLLFSRNAADLAILEVGLGGRLDATNVVERPAACVITPVDLDHQAFLGDTLAVIAAEKAGIIKQGVPVVCAPQNEAALAVIEARAAACEAPLWRLGQEIGCDRHADGTLDYQDPLGVLALPAPGLKARIRLAMRLSLLRRCARADCLYPTRRGPGSFRLSGLRACSALKASSRPSCQRGGNSGSTADITRTQVRHLQSLSRHGRIVPCM